MQPVRLHRKYFYNRRAKSSKKTMTDDLKCKIENARAVQIKRKGHLSVRFSETN